MRVEHKIGIDANRPIGVEGPDKGAIADTVADPDIIASTGAGWVRLNFVLGPWSSPDDQRQFHGKTWLQTYHTVVDQFLAKGLKIYGLISQEAVRTDQDHDLHTLFRQPEDKTADMERLQGHSWIQQYATNFGRIAREFHDKVEYFESFNEPDDWHGMEGVNWVHPTWFAHMLQKVHTVVKDELGLTGAQLITGPLQGLHHHEGALGAPAHTYLRMTYAEGHSKLGWRPGRYPFDGIGYHPGAEQQAETRCCADE